MKKASILTVLALMCAGCASQGKIDFIKKEAIGARLSLADDYDLPEIAVHPIQKDTLTIKDEKGNDIFIMKAVMDENGEMVATDVLSAAKVSARFRNIAERHGKVSLSFDISVPSALQDGKWQLRFYPDLYTLGDSTRLEPIFITGNEYRKAQLRGYEQYRKFLSSIITDSSRFYFGRQLELFIERNLPEIYRFRNDSSVVTDENFRSAYGVSEQEAVKHYTNWLLLRHNQRKISLKDKYFRKYVKAPIEDGLRLDTVITDADNNLLYRYTQTIAAKPGLKRADIILSGEIFEQDRCLLKMPAGDSLTFYISSLNALVDDRERYITKVIERKASADANFMIGFEKGSTEIKSGFEDNLAEIGMVKKYLLSLMENTDFDLDSIIVSSSCSPEGNSRLNSRLSLKRSQSVSSYFAQYIDAVDDSLAKEEGVLMDMNGNYRKREKRTIPFISKSQGENWKMLASMVAGDSVLTAAEKEKFNHALETENADEREDILKSETFYPYLLGQLYPKLRNVNFDFRLHRKGMVKDTVHTTVIDSVYQKGLAALRQKEYKTAAALLKAYDDYNTAVALCALDYNASALDILLRSEKTDKAEYLMAILYSRRGESEKAVQHYLNACNMNRAFISRGNLDPEISELIRTYGLHNNLYQ